MICYRVLRPLDVCEGWPKDLTHYGVFPVGAILGLPDAHWLEAAVSSGFLEPLGMWTCTCTPPTAEGE